MKISSAKTGLALLIMGLASFVAHATPVVVLTKPNTYDTIYGVNFGTSSTYTTSFLGG
ncbi:hypothetical protein [Rhodoferax mekongensis]|uniref:Uncharacterized protein n=1 Tax=Rhodoferax mekongensis TaxID=3068341 RepID=A0ABZ0AXE1_9BURK|nr:hypothetical protein [Rhodoferax sp. TBRC 17307]WNO04298.1 hypothetical protein RAN89_15530 [Rhodoferax sp. TBRC 17307]